MMTQRGAVLVTGGGGYIGAHCCKALHEAGYLPVAFDDFSTGHRGFVKWGPAVEGNVQDPKSLEAVFRTQSFVAVMHFAAVSAVGESVVDPHKYYTNNVGGTLTLLCAMRDAGCQNLIFSSTGAVYGNASSEPIAEGAAKSPINPYGRSKLMIEQILADYRTAHGLRSFCFRYFNASGADSSGEIGEDREPETHLIPRAIMALQGHGDFAIFGNDYPTPDGTAIRDYIHVSDLAAAHLMGAEMLASGHGGGTYNLGTGAGYSVKDVLSAIFRETGVTMPLVYRPRRAGDPPTLIADPSAALRDLGFKPTRSSLDTIIATAWRWHSNIAEHRHSA